MGRLLIFTNDGEAREVPGIRRGWPTSSEAYREVNDCATRLLEASRTRCPNHIWLTQVGPIL